MWLNNTAHPPLPLESYARRLNSHHSEAADLIYGHWARWRRGPNSPSAADAAAALAHLGDRLTVGSLGITEAGLYTEGGNPALDIFSGFDLKRRPRSRRPNPFGHPPVFPGLRSSPTALRVPLPGTLGLCRRRSAGTHPRQFGVVDFQWAGDFLFGQRNSHRPVRFRGAETLMGIPLRDRSGFAPPAEGELGAIWSAHRPPATEVLPLRSPEMSPLPDVPAAAIPQPLGTLAAPLPDYENLWGFLVRPADDGSSGRWFLHFGVPLDRRPPSAAVRRRSQTHGRCRAGAALR